MRVIKKCKTFSYQPKTLGFFSSDDLIVVIHLLREKCQVDEFIVIMFAQAQRVLKIMRQNHPFHFSHNVDWHYYQLLKFLSRFDRLGLISRYIFEKQFGLANLSRPLQTARVTQRRKTDESA